MPFSFFIYFNKDFNNDFNDHSGNGNHGTHTGTGYSNNTPTFIDLIYGCTDSAAGNYDETANVDDGSCEYPSPSDDDIFIEEHVLDFTQYSYIESSLLEEGVEYYLKVFGIWGGANGDQRDAAFQFSVNPIIPETRWGWGRYGLICQGLSPHRPIPDEYNEEHIYYFYFTGEETSEEFCFQDGLYSDNFGSLTIQIWEMVEQEPELNNYSLSFDGCDWCDDYISMGDILDPGDNSFTFEAWVYANTLPLDYYAANIVSNGVTGGGTPSNNGFFIRIYEGQSYISAGVSDGTFYILNSSNISANQWYHVSIVINRELSLFSLFVNGILEDETDISNLGPLDNNGYFRIGDQYWANNGQNAQVWDGNIDEVRFWDTAISQEELNNNMYSYLDGNENGLLAYWPLDEGTGSTAIDQTGNGNNGTINGATWDEDGAPVDPPPPPPDDDN